jgi:hypothetical protein
MHYTQHVTCRQISLATVDASYGVTEGERQTLLQVVKCSLSFSFLFDCLARHLARCIYKLVEMQRIGVESGGGEYMFGVVKAWTHWSNANLVYTGQ